MWNELCGVKLFEEGPIDPKQLTYPDFGHMSVFVPKKFAEDILRFQDDLYLLIYDIKGDGHAGRMTTFFVPNVWKVCSMLPVEDWRILMASAYLGYRLGKLYYKRMRPCQNLELDGMRYFTPIKE